MLFKQSDQELIDTSAIHTTKEILQQPNVWKEISQDLESKRADWKQFFDSIYKKYETVRVIFTGAGSSAFIGETLVPTLNNRRDDKVRFEAIATTDIVSNPTHFLKPTEPTVLVSFARSGNSPESVATVELAEKIISDLYHVVITCNKEGELAKRTKDDPDSFLVLLPDEVNDRAFAMTSSFSSMTLAAYQLFADEADVVSSIDYLAEQAELLLKKIDEVTEEILNFDFDRIVYLGSGTSGKLTREAALKMLELTNGRVAPVYETSLGFRHGPKAFLKEKTLVVVFLSQDPYTKQYDLDILKEISQSAYPLKIAALTESQEELSEWADWVVAVNNGPNKFASDFYLAMLYTLFAQTIALKKSLQLGITPDNPVPDGSVNRVVKGVVIYPWEKEEHKE